MLLGNVLINNVGVGCGKEFFVKQELGGIP